MHDSYKYRKTRMMRQHVHVHVRTVGRYEIHSLYMYVVRECCKEMVRLDCINRVIV